jgi:hypothetical protein
MAQLFYASTAIYRSFLLLLDEAEECLRTGGTPLFLTCDGSLSRYCFANVSGRKSVCRCCRFMRKEGMRALSKPVQYYSIRDLLREEDIRRIQAMRFDYETVSEIYAIRHREVDIGYAALSHYICCTRNYEPTLTPELRHVIDGFLRTAVFLTEAIERFINEHRLESASLFNGRAFDTRPVLRKCVAAGIKTHVFEMIGPGVNVEKVCFPDSLPHNIEMQGRWIEEQWKRAIEHNKQDAIRIGQSFFDKRRSGIRAGDRVYITNQQKDMLPTNWDSAKKNIVFFSSSEDEFVAIDKEWEAGKYAPTQIAGIRKILDLLRDSSDLYHLYLRVHPNLAKVTFAYHTDLYILERDYPNVTVLPPESPVSSYALIDHADKVVVFGSTVGIEAVYWGKPVILMGPAYYQHLGACYIPKDDADLRRLLVSDLAPLSQTAAVKYGYSILGSVGTPFRHFDFSLFWPDLLLRKIVKHDKTRALILKPSLATVHRVTSAIQTLCAKFSARSLRKVSEHDL